MDILEDKKVVGIVILGALLVVGTLGRLIYNDLMGTSDLIVWAPADSDAAVSLDGDAPVTVHAGGHRVLEARRGKHEVVSTVNGQAFKVPVKLGSGGARYAVPTTEHQCFAVADVTRMYAHPTVLAQAARSKSIASELEPRMEKRLTDHSAALLPKWTGAGAESMPATRRKGSIFVAAPFECDDMKASDDTLLAMMRL
jgi:hypothetical protein